jgi:hypothetical protein
MYRIILQEVKYALRFELSLFSLEQRPGPRGHGRLSGLSGLAQAASHPHFLNRVN